MAMKITVIAFVLLLLHTIISSESVSFSFDFKDGVPPSIILQGDAAPYASQILLTKTDITNNLSMPHSAGRAVYSTPIHLWDSDTGEVADFTTNFSFAVSSGGSDRRGDGLTFFMEPIDAALSLPANSSGGFLGLFSPDTALNYSQNSILAVELDSFGNEDWDPPFPHVGIDYNTLMSVNTDRWPIDVVPPGSIGNARISYEYKTKTMNVSIGYPDVQTPTFVSLSLIFDMKDVLPEYVRIGLSAATGDFVESHNIFSWSFRTLIPRESSS
ncbi:agglutinin-2-like [Neltuma alba]|uniref:agglutinin-2-like n=1 Tax=Neltuma alba TaxID=207710 RepID=UPI0010A2ACF3|nr:agglutinin-2-like [Prosopis alba]